MARCIDIVRAPCNSIVVSGGTASVTRPRASQVAKSMTSLITCAFTCSWQSPPVGLRLCGHAHWQPEADVNIDVESRYARFGAEFMFFGGP